MYEFHCIYNNISKKLNFIKIEGILLKTQAQFLCKNVQKDKTIDRLFKFDTSFSNQILNLVSHKILMEIIIHYS